MALYEILGEVIDNATGQPFDVGSMQEFDPENERTLALSTNGHIRRIENVPAEPEEVKDEDTSLNPPTADASNDTTGEGVNIPSSPDANTRGAADPESSEPAPVQDSEPTAPESPSNGD